MRMPFERLVEEVSRLSDEDTDLPMGKLAERWGEPAARIADAMDALKMLRGERTRIPPPAAPDRAMRAQCRFEYCGAPPGECDTPE